MRYNMSLKSVTLYLLQVEATAKYSGAVVLGIESEGQVTVLSGLEEGEEVVTSSQFLVDSESKLHEAIAKMIESLNYKKLESKKPAEAAETMKINNILSFFLAEEKREKI